MKFGKIIGWIGVVGGWIGASALIGAQFGWGLGGLMIVLTALSIFAPLLLENRAYTTLVWLAWGVLVWYSLAVLAYPFVGYAWALILPAVILILGVSWGARFVHAQFVKKK